MDILEAIIQSIERVKDWTDNKKADKSTMNELSKNIPDKLMVVDNKLYLAKDGSALQGTAVSLSQLAATDNGDGVITLSFTTSNND